MGKQKKTAKKPVNAPAGAAKPKKEPVSAPAVKAKPAAKTKTAGPVGRFLTLNSMGAPLLWRENCPWWEKFSQGFALVMLCLFPLLMGPRGYYTITKDKFDIFAVLTVIYVVLCLFIFLAFPFGTGIKRREKPLQHLTLPQIFLMGYMVWAIISAIASPYEMVWYGQSRYEGLFSLLLYGVIFLLLSFWGEHTDGYFYGMAAMAVIFGLLGFIQSFGTKLLYPDDYWYWNSKFLTTVGNIDCVAGVLCILIPVLLCTFVLLENRWRYLCLPGLFLLVYLLLFSDTDTGKLGLAAVVLLLPFMLDTRRHIASTLIGLVPMAAAAALHELLHYNWEGTLTVVWPGRSLRLLIAAVVLALLGWLLGRSEKPLPVKPRTMRIAVAVVIAAGIVGCLVFLYGYSGENRLLTDASELLHGRLADSAGTRRGYIWNRVFLLIRERPILGGGPGTLMERFEPYKAGYGYGGNVSIDFAHNDFLQIAVCEGLVGLALYVAFLVSLAVRCLRTVGRNPVLVILMAGIMGYLVYSFFVFSIAIVTPLFWVLAGLADKCVRQTAPPPAEEGSAT